MTGQRFLGRRGPRARLRQRETCAGGGWRCNQGMSMIERAADGERTVTALNAGDAPVELVLPWDAPTARDGVTGQRFLAEGGVLRVTLSRWTA